MFPPEEKDSHDIHCKTHFARELLVFQPTRRWCSEAGQAKVAVNVTEKRLEYVSLKRECVIDVTAFQCDQIRATCSQCLKAKDARPCPGYRDEQTLEFFDESREVARKARGKQAVKLRRRESGLEYSSSSSESSTSSPPEPDELCLVVFRGGSPISFQESSVSRALLPSVENLGPRSFLANYVLSDSDLCAGHMQNLPLWKMTQSTTRQVAVEAVGLAGLSSQRSDPRLMAKARHQYAMALQMTKGHVEDPSRCKQDRTITAVAFLGLFEVRPPYRC